MARTIVGGRAGPGTLAWERTGVWTPATLRPRFLARRRGTRRSICDDSAVDPGTSPRKTPLVIAHRGASDEEPEHTLAAYRRAFERGVDGIECDVRLTADRHLVCVHDRKISRTSNGQGVVSSLELARLEAFDWASWKQNAAEAETPDADPERGRLLTLARLLDTITSRPEELVTLIETKHPNRYGGLLEEHLLAMLRRFGLGDGDQPGRPHVRVMSFSHLALARMTRIAPAVPLVYLMEKNVPALSWDGALPYGVRKVGLDVRFLRQPKVVRSFQKRGHEVLVWTVNEAADVERCLELGVDVMITDRPAFVRAHAEHLLGTA